MEQRANTAFAEKEIKDILSVVQKNRKAGNSVYKGSHFPVLK